MPTPPLVHAGAASKTHLVDRQAWCPGSSSRACRFPPGTQATPTSSAGAGSLEYVISVVEWNGVFVRGVIRLASMALIRRAASLSRSPRLLGATSFATSASPQPSPLDGAMAIVPGVATAAAVMLSGFEVSDVLGKALLESQGLVAKAGSSPISGVPVAILLGLALKNQPLLALPASLGPGLVFCTKKVLQTGIICVGAKLSVYDVASTGSAW